MRGLVKKTMPLPPPPPTDTTEPSDDATAVINLQLMGAME